MSAASSTTARAWIAMELVEGVRAQPTACRDGPARRRDAVNRLRASGRRRARRGPPPGVHPTRDPQARQHHPLARRRAVPDPRESTGGSRSRVRGARFTAMNEANGDADIHGPPSRRAATRPRSAPMSTGLGVVGVSGAHRGGRPFVGGERRSRSSSSTLNRPPPALAPRCPDAPVRPWSSSSSAMLAKDFKERPTAAEITASLGKLRAVRQPPPSHAGREPSPATPCRCRCSRRPRSRRRLTLVPAWPDPED